MPHLGVPELGIILVIVIIIFGVGKLPQIGGAIGQSIREFRAASRSDEDEDEKETAYSSRKSRTRTSRPKQEVVEEAEEEETLEEEEQS